MHPSDYPHPDLVDAYIARKGVATFHIPHIFTNRGGELDQADATPCGKELEELIKAGTARALGRRGLKPCAQGCATELTELLEPDLELEEAGG